MNKRFRSFILGLAVGLIAPVAHAQAVGPAPGWFAIYLVDESPAAGSAVGDILVQPGPDLIKPNNLPDHAWLKPAVIIDSSMIVSAEPNGDSIRIRLELTPEGQRRFSDAIARNVGKRIALVLGGRLIGDPVVEVAIPTGSSLIILPPGGGLRFDPQGRFTDAPLAGFEGERNRMIELIRSSIGKEKAPVA